MTNFSLTTIYRNAVTFTGRASNWKLGATLLLFVALGLWNLGAVAPWWDEGWTLSVARTIVERGMYARLLNGQPAASGLEAAIPVTESVALSFRLLGVGLWQGRVPGVLFGSLALGLLFILARQLYNPRVAWCALLSNVLLAGHPHINILVMARQVLGEVPMLVALLGALLCIGAMIRGRYFLILPAIFLGTLTMSIKLQVQPFWVLGLISGVASAFVLQQRRVAAMLGVILICNLVLLKPFGALLNWVAQPIFPLTPLAGLFEVTAVVTDLQHRTFNLLTVGIFGLLTVFGVFYAASTWIKARQQASCDQAALIVRAILLGIVGSWLLWFLTLALGITRYLFPAYFLGSVFAAALLHDLTDGFTIRSVAEKIKQRRLTRITWRSYVATLFVILSLSLSLVALAKYYVFASDDSAIRVANILNALPPQTRIETYETELHFLLNQPYHYPPDEANVAMIQYRMFGHQPTFEYNPLVADPDYLVVVGSGPSNLLYGQAITAGYFKLKEQIGGYQVYIRVR